MARLTPAHPTESLRVPGPHIVDIDKRMVPLIRECWRLGLRTLHCCEGRVVERPAGGAGREAWSEYGLSLAYIAFESVLEAVVFAACATAGKWEMHATGWRVEADILNTVRFPSADIERATESLRRHGVAPRRLVADYMDRVGADISDREAIRVAPHRTCAHCGGPILASRRKDARYCSRVHQLAARCRSRKQVT